MKKLVNSKLNMALIIIISFLLVGCSKEQNTANNLNSGYYKVEDSPAGIKLSLSEAAQSVSDSLQNLSAIRRSEYPENSKLPFEHLKTGKSLKEMLAFQWYGPVQPLSSDIAKKVGYKLQFYGKKPATPVLIDINTTQAPETALAILRNIELQAGLNASVMVLPEQRIISLRYN